MWGGHDRNRHRLVLISERHMTYEKGMMWTDRLKGKETVLYDMSKVELTKFNGDGTENRGDFTIDERKRLVAYNLLIETTYPTSLREHSSIPIARVGSWEL